MVLSPMSQQNIEDDSKEGHGTYETIGATATEDGTLLSRDHSLEERTPPPSAAKRWSDCILSLHRPTLALIHAISTPSAKYPWMTIALTAFLSVGLASVGLATNFNFNGDTETLWTPSTSLAMQHFEWIRDESGFNPPARLLALLFHKSGDNVLTIDTLERAFEALNVVRTHPEFDAACAMSDFIFRGVPQCPIVGPTRMWSNDAAQFRSEIRTDDDVRSILAETYFPDNLPVPHSTIYGALQRNRTYASFAQAFTVVVALPEGYFRSKEIELEMVDKLLELQQIWENDPDNTVMMETVAHGSIPAELIRAVNEDLPLIPLVFVIMSLFTSAVFFKRHPIYSRSGLGASAVVAVMLSILTGFGLMFCIGVPFTTITQLIPFLVFGIGLDDAFIVVGSYMRTDPSKDSVVRIQETMDDIGLSITLTTLTTATAFGLGCLSSVPAVYWLCQYCLPTVFFVFFFQLTFFVACIVLDERRIKAKRRDLFVWQKVADVDSVESPETAHFVDTIMERYARVLLLPVVRICVVLGFLCLLVASVFSCLQLEQDFQIQDIIPRVSYVRDYLEANEIYYNDTGSFTGEVYFRYVDHGNSTNRQTMKKYIDTLNDLPFVEEIPSTSMWMSVFDLNLALVYPDLVDAPFPEQVEAFLATELNFNAFRKDLVLDSDGNIIASKIPVVMHADFTDVFDQIGVLQDERNVTFSLDVNQGRGDDLAFFTFADIYTVFEFYLVCVAELISTTIYGVVSVSLVAMLFIPHWSAIFFVCPMICILYVDLLGVIQWAGLHINSLTYLGLTMSIGLLVDFIMHILFRYYEVPGNRIEKTKEMLKTMGSSILLGGVTTFLGITPLYFTSSNAFRVIFTTFVGIVTLGVGHGLVLMPVVLATFGPETQVSMSFRRDDNKTDAENTPKVVVKKIGGESGFGDVEEEIFSFQNAVKSLTYDKEKRFREILEFVIDYAQAAGFDPEFVLHKATWGSPDGEVSTEEGEQMNEKKETFGQALVELFRFAEEHGLDAHAALRQEKESTYFNLPSKNIRAETFIPLRHFDSESDFSENECDAESDYSENEC